MTITTEDASEPRFIEELTVEGYGCIESETFRLSALHAFVGPNDSGKSTLLRAVKTLLVAGSSQDGEGMQLLHGRDPRLSATGNSRLAMRLRGHSTRYELARAGNNALERLVRTTDGESEVLTCPLTLGSQASVLRAGASHLIVRTRTNLSFAGRVVPPGEITILGPEDAKMVPASAVRLDELDREMHELSAWIAPPSVLRLDPDALRAPSPLIPRGPNPVRFRDERGSGLPGVLEAIRDRDEASWGALRDLFLKMFPLVRSLHLPSVSEARKGVEIELRNGQRIGAALMSEGMLYFLAFLAVAHGDRTPVFLIEEPENGLHPARIAEVMTVLREVSKSAQVILATHSPLVLNELQGDEVTVLWRDEEHGTRGKLLEETKGYEKRSKIYALGELWVSYANGIDEAPLREGTARE